MSLESQVVALPGPPPLAMKVLDAGSRGAPTLLCIHGVGGQKEHWRPQLARFSADHRVVAPDLRGHGERPEADAGCTIERVTEDLHQLLAELHLRTPLVAVTHCYGAVFALELARRHPGLVSRLVLIAVAERLHHGLLLEAATRAPLPASVLELGRRLLFSRRLHAHAGVLRALMREIEAWDGWRHLDGIAQPVLAIAGRSDSWAPPPDMADLARRLPAGRLRVVERAHHKVHLQDPVETNRLIEEFLAGERVGLPAAS